MFYLIKFMKKKLYLYLNYVKICYILEMMYVNIVCLFSGVLMVNVWWIIVCLESWVSMCLFFRVIVNCYCVNLLL